ncbi:MAG: cupin domain-containing protein [Sphingobium sp.]|nr:cupin domain-containing protein [Sphingobium sp.]
MVVAGNLLHSLPDAQAAEIFEAIVSRPGVRVERIISHGQVTPEDQPYIQPYEEWVLILSGHARLWVDGVGEVSLHPGDYYLIPAHAAHRVTWTCPDEPTIWLTLHFDEQEVEG